MTTQVITSYNSVITFTPDIDPVNSFKFEGFAKDNIMTIDDVDNVGHDRGADGQSVAYAKNVLIPLSFHFLPSSSTLFNIQLLQTAVTLTGIPVTGTLEVYVTSLKRSYLYNEFVIESSIKGLPLEFDKLGNVVIKASANPPIPVQL